MVVHNMLLQKDTLTAWDELDELFSLIAILNNKGDKATCGAGLELGVVLVALDLDALGSWALDDGQEIFNFENLLGLRR